MDWLLVLSIAGAIGTVFSVYQVIKERWPSPDSKQSEKAKALFYPFAIIALTSVSVYLATLNQELTEIKAQAKILRATWPESIESLTYSDNGTSLGIVNGGLSFVEQYEDHIPVTVEQARELSIEARRLCVDPAKAEACDAAAGGMMGLIGAIAAEPD